MLDTKDFDPALFEGKAANAARLLRVMSNEHRLMILCRLGSGERSVSELHADFNLSQSSLSQHLSKLREDGLVATRRESQSIYYRIEDPAAIQIIETLAAIFCPEMLK